MDLLDSNSSAENVKIIRNYRNLMDEIDALVPYEEREYKEEEDNDEDGCWENGGTIEGLLAYIKRIRDEHKTLKDENKTLKEKESVEDAYLMKWVRSLMAREAILEQELDALKQ